jgi:hypothetical protein
MNDPDPELVEGNGESKDQLFAICATTVWVPHPCRVLVFAAIPVPEWLYPRSITLKWHFSQENATLHDASKGTGILEPV